MTINDLKTLLDAATNEVETAMRVGGFIAWNHQAPLQEKAVNLLPAFLRLWEAAEKMSDYIEDDGTGPYFPNPSTAHALLFSMHATLQELRDTKGTQ